jgi:hypothetical protein
MLFDPLIVWVHCATHVSEAVRESAGYPIFAKTIAFVTPLQQRPKTPVSAVDRRIA